MKSLVMWSKREFKHNVMEMEKVKNRLIELSKQTRGRMRRMRRELKSLGFMHYGKGKRFFGNNEQG